MGPAGGPRHIIEGLGCVGILADFSAWAEAKGIVVFAVGEVGCLQVVNLSVSRILVDLSFVGHGAHIATVDELFKSLRVDKVCFLVLVLKGNPAGLVVVQPVHLFVLRQVGRGVDRGT